MVTHLTVWLIETENASLYTYYYTVCIFYSITQRCGPWQPY